MITNTSICLSFLIKSIQFSKSEHYMVKIYRIADKLVRKMRWKAFLFSLNDKESIKNKCSGTFPLRKKPKEDKDVEKLGIIFFYLTRSLNFRFIKNPLF